MSITKFFLIKKNKSVLIVAVVNEVFSVLFMSFDYSFYFSYSSYKRNRPSAAVTLFCTRTMHSRVTATVFHTSRLTSLEWTVYSRLRQGFRASRRWVCTGQARSTCPSCNGACLCRPRPWLAAPTLQRRKCSPEAPSTAADAFRNAARRPSTSIHTGIRYMEWNMCHVLGGRVTNLGWFFLVIPAVFMTVVWHTYLFRPSVTLLRHVFSNFRFYIWPTTCLFLVLLFTKPHYWFFQFEVEKVLLLILHS